MTTNNNGTTTTLPQALSDEAQNIAYRFDALPESVRVEILRVTAIDHNDTDVDINDRTRERIRAFIYSLRPLRGSDLAASDEYQDGRVLLERLADSAGESAHNPTLRFSIEQCAQVCDYLRTIEPFEPANWWVDPEDAPSRTCGFQFVVGAIAASLRQPGDPEDAETPAADTEQDPAAPTLKSIKEQLEKLDSCLVDLMNLVGCVADAASQAEHHKISGSLRIAETGLRDLTDATDRISLDVHELLWPKEIQS